MRSISGVQKKVLVMASLVLLCSSVFVGCSKSEQKPSAAPAQGAAESPDTGPTEPVTIKVFQQYAGITDLDFNYWMKQPVEKKFPKVTLELVRAGKGTMPVELLSTGEYPDITFTSSLNMLNFTDLNIPADVSELIKKYNVDMNKFQPRAINEIKSFSSKNEMLAMPFSLNFGLLFYNKNIFERYGVPYPKDGMTLEDTIKIAKVLGSASEGKIAAFEPNSPSRLGISRLLPKVDPKTNKSLLNTEPWKEYFDLYQQIRSIPGNATSGNLVNRFFKDQNVGMTLTYGGTFGNSEAFHQEGADMSFWDVATFPIQSGSGPKGIETEERILLLSSTSKNKDLAFKIMNFLSSQEVQELVAKRGQMSVLNDTKTKELFGSELPSLKGKNIQAAFKNVYNANPTPTKYDKEVELIAERAMNTGVLKEKKDINTALREADEEANKKIAELMK